MSNYTRNIVKTFEFDGDSITVEFSRLKRKHLMALSPFLSDDGAMKFSDQMEMINAASEFIPELIQSFDGLKDSNGDVISLSEVLEESYFTPLVSDILSAIMDVSFLNQADVKNSKEQQGESSVD